MRVKEPCEVRLIATGAAMQISLEDYQVLNDPVSPSVHMIDGSFIELFPCVYRHDVDRMLADEDDTVFFRADVQEFWDVYHESWFTMVDVVARSFLGAISASKVRASPGRWRDTPFFPLVVSGHYGGGLSPSSVRGLQRAFEMSRSSGQMESFLDTQRQEHPEVGVILATLQGLLDRTAQRGGMLLFR